MLVLLFKLLAISFVFHYYKNRYPEEYQGYVKQLFEYMENNERLKNVLPYLVNIGYAFIYVYSYFQILLDKTIRFTSPYVKLLRDKMCDVLVKYNVISGKPEPNVVINDKTAIAFYNEGKLIKQDELLTRFNSLLISDINECQPTDKYNLVTIADLKNILTFIPDECKYDLLDIRFLALYLKHDDKSYIIDLCTNSQNYYVVGNVINSAFLKYYLTNILNTLVDDSKPFVYTLELMDHNVQMVYLDETQSIVFQKDGYIVIKESETNVVNDILEDIEKIVLNEIEETVVNLEPIKNLVVNLETVSNVTEEPIKNLLVNLETVSSVEETVVNLEPVSNEIEEPIKNLEPVVNLEPE